MPLSRRLPALFLLAFLCAVASAAAEAKTYCVADTEALRDALSDASVLDGEHDIRLRRGTFVAQATAQGYYNALYLTLRETHSVAISGGWSGWNGTCETQTLDARLTTIDGEYSGRLFYIVRADGASGGFTLRNLGLRRGYARDANGLGGCLAFHASNQSGNNVFENLIASDCRADAAFGAFALYVGRGNTVARNLLLQRNSAPYDSAMKLSTEGNAFVSNLTAVDNRSDGGYAALDLAAAGNGAIVLSNSLFWNNAGQDLYLGSDDIFLVRNLLEAESGGYSPAASLSEGNLVGVDPGLAGDGLRPARGSAAIDHGTDTPFGGAAAFDLEGQPRLQGARIDLGALEYAGLHADGFE